MNVRHTVDVHEFLRSRILSGELSPNTRLKEQEVAARLGISRTPVREALARLEMEGLVKIIPRKGAVVSQIELDEIDEIYEIRASLETLVARRACERATEAEIEAMEQELRQAEKYLQSHDLLDVRRHTAQFHVLLNRCSRSPRLIALLRTLDDGLEECRRRSRTQPGRAEGAMRQHLAILEGLRRRDPAEMQRSIEEHAERGRLSAIKAYLEEGRARRMEA